MNTEKYVTSIKILKFKNIGNIDILLDQNKRKHLIITGKNGAGKTSLLSRLNEILHSPGDFDLDVKRYEERLKDFHENRIQPGASTSTFVTSIPDPYLNTDIGISYNTNSNIYKYVIYFEANRFSDRKKNTSISKSIPFKYSSSGSNDHLMEYLVKQKFAQLLAIEAGDHKTAKNITDWFSNFEKKLSRILGYNIYLKFNAKNYNFLFIREDDSILYFHSLPGGYYALVNIITDIIIKTDINLPGIVLIDEVETHLHVEFQKMILPLLVDFFPYIQFIITTHSPFVVSSLSNAVICDLEKKIVTDDLSGYGYDTLVESFFGTSLISDELRSKIDRYDELEKIESKTAEQNKEHNDLVNYLLNLPKYIPNELSLKLKTIEIAELRKRK